MISHALHLTNPFARGRVLYLLAAVPLVALFAIACGSDGEAVDEPTRPPIMTELPDDDTTDIPDDFADPPPPALTATIGEASIEAGLGSFCYGTVCADAIGYTTAADLLRVVDATEFHAELEFETIAEISVIASPTSSLGSQPICTSTDGVRPGGPLCVRDGDWLAWTGALGEGSVLSATADGGTTDVDVSSLEPGIYVVVFSVRFESGGDASYGVLLEVEE